MSIIAKIAIIIAMLIMPLGLLLAVEGSYFHDMTSQEKINNLIDASAEDVFRSQIGQFSSQCEALNLSCSSLSELENSLCPKVEEFKTTANSQSLVLCTALNLTCADVADAELKVCNALGRDNDICKQLNTLSAQITQAQDTCDQIKGFEQSMEKTKQEAYAKEVPGFGGISIAKINSMLANSSLIGILIFLATIAITYLASKNIMTVSHSISFTLLTTGVTMLVIGYFGFSIMTSMVTSQLGDASIVDKLPSLMNFTKDIFDYQSYIGTILTALGLIGFAGTLIAGKFYFKQEKKKK